MLDNAHKYLYIKCSAFLCMSASQFATVCINEPPSPNICSKLYFIRCESAAQSALSAASQFSHTHNRTVVQSLCVCVWEAICSLYTRQSPYLWTISSKHWNAISLNIRTCFFVQKYADRYAKPMFIANCLSYVRRSAKTATNLRIYTRRTYIIKCYRWINLRLIRIEG